MRWADPVAWLRTHLGDPGDVRALAAAAVLFALQRENGARWLFGPSDGGSWIAVRNVCATSYRGDGLRLRILVSEEHDGVSPRVRDSEELHLCKYGRQPLRQQTGATAGVSEWYVGREGGRLVVARSHPALALTVDAQSLAAAIPGQ